MQNLQCIHRWFFFLFFFYLSYHLFLDLYISLFDSLGPKHFFFEKDTAHRRRHSSYYTIVYDLDSGFFSRLQPRIGCVIGFGLDRKDRFMRKVRGAQWRGRLVSKVLLASLFLSFSPSLPYLRFSRAAQVSRARTQWSNYNEQTNTG